ncbi:hypothetical protein FQN52_002164 [Onygenales sp. PD_12]|nr:hypothetical protein FQN52_002164 [Onygenales sp. PD_12]
MSTGNSQPVSQAPVRDLHPPVAHQPPSIPHGASSPPSKRDLTSWWKQFVQKSKKDEEAARPSGIFGVPLNVSITYANVAISLSREDGSSFIYGYVPIVVAKCGVFLKEKATDVEGIFRLSGSAKRIKDLQEVFDSPDRFGKGLDWSGYTVHDAANILRRYLNQLPEPIVPLKFYDRFRDPLRHHQAQAAGDKETPSDEEKGFDHGKTVATYQALIKELPPLNRQLLLYILDLLTVFASKSEINRMTAANLAAIFQPGLLSHPAHDMAPKEYKLSQDVLIFLIENQDNFLFGMTGTASDAQTVKAMQAGPAPLTPRPTVRRSASNASAGADSLRKYDALRRNVSVSSKHSRNSGNATSPATPGSGTGVSLGVHRSNTVPSKKLGGLPPSPLNIPAEQSTPRSGGLTPSVHSYRPSRSPSRTPPLSRVVEPPESAPKPTINTNTGLGLINSEGQSQQASPDDPAPPQGLGTKPSTPQLSGTPTKERKLSSLFVRAAPVDKEGRQPNRLRKKRPMPGSASESARSSSHSLHATPEGPALGALVSQAVAERQEVRDQSQISTPKISNLAPTTPTDETAPQPKIERKQSGPVSPEKTLKPGRSRTPSIRSRSSVTDHSDFDHQDDSVEGRKKHQRKSWRFHRSSRRKEDQSDFEMSPPPPIGSNPHAGFSNSSFGSSNWPQKSLTNDSRHISAETSATGTTGTGNQSSYTLPTQESDLSANAQTTSFGHQRDPGESEKKGGFFGKFKAKVAHVKEGVKEREAERERAKSPPHSDGEKAASRNSLSFFPSRDAKRPSMDVSRERLPPAESQESRPQPQPQPQSQPQPQPQQPTVVPSTSSASIPSPIVPGAFPEPVIPEEPAATTPAATTPAPKDAPSEGVAVLAKVEEDVPQSPPSTTETITAATATTVQPQTARDATTVQPQTARESQPSPQPAPNS